MMWFVAIQYALDTGRYHPTVYRWSPMPGPGPDPVLRYKSHAHHTRGFGAHGEAVMSAAAIAREFDATTDFEPFAISTAGPDVLIRTG